ncbi:MAG: hypothetical protein DI539_10595 [Flavobacterium psychrophilum]|nr:MAG: hypothetical protein DI539_10595 [Flavobacterium psychrophilum]
MENNGHKVDNDFGCVQENEQYPGNEIPFSAIGNRLVRKIDFDGIRFLYGKLKFIRPIPVQVVNDAPYIVMFFSLAGSRDSYFTESNKRSTVAAGYHNLYYIPDSKFFIEPSATDEENIYVQVQFTQDYFRRFTPVDHSLLSAFVKKIDNREFSVLSFGNMRITGEMYAILNKMVQCDKEGIIKQLYIEANALKLLLLQFDQCGSVANVPKGKNVKQHDLEKFESVKEYLENNIAHNHSLTELSRRSGLNDFKLKKGFKELFGTTVFSYLHELRMSKAAELLRDEEKTIAEIAECCGYAYVQSFCTAFKQKYGISPEKYRKKERPLQHSRSLFL